MGKRLIIHLFNTKTEKEDNSSLQSTWNLDWLFSFLNEKIKECNLEGIIKVSPIKNCFSLNLNEDKINDPEGAESYLHNVVKVQAVNWLTKGKKTHFFFGITPCETTSAKDKNPFGILLEEKIALLSINSWQNYSPPSVEIYMLFFLARNLFRSLCDPKYLDDKNPNCALFRLKYYPYEVIDVIESEICGDCRNKFLHEFKNDPFLSKIYSFIQCLMGFSHQEAKMQKSEDCFNLPSRERLVLEIIQKIKLTDKSDELKAYYNIPSLKETPFDFIIKRNNGERLFCHVCYSLSYVSNKLIEDIISSEIAADHRKLLLYPKLEKQKCDFLSTIDKYLLKEIIPIEINEGTSDFSCCLPKEHRPKNYSIVQNHKIFIKEAKKCKSESKQFDNILLKYKLSTILNTEIELRDKEFPKEFYNYSIFSDTCINKLQILSQLGYSRYLRNFSEKVRKNPVNDIEETQKFLRSNLDTIVPPDFIEIQKTLEKITKLAKIREHYIHQFQVYLLGCVILERLRRKIVEREYDIPTEAYEERSEEYKEKSKQIEKELDNSWLLASLLHDSCSSIENWQNISEKTYSALLNVKVPKSKKVFFTPNLSQIDPKVAKKVVTSLDKKGLLGPLKQNDREKAFKKCIKENNHALLGAYCLLKHIRKSGISHLVDVHAVISAIAVHHRKIYCLSGMKANGDVIIKMSDKLSSDERKSYKRLIKERIVFEENPIVYLLILCDAVHEWGRIDTEIDKLYPNEPQLHFEDFSPDKIGIVLKYSSQDSESIGDYIKRMNKKKKELNTLKNILTSKHFEIYCKIKVKPHHERPELFKEAEERLGKVYNFGKNKNGGV